VRKWRTTERGSVRWVLIAVRVLTWNLMHGRSVPPAGVDLFEEFVGALAGWEWDVALLQEVPPWWPPALAKDLQAEQRLVLTSRNSLLPLRQAIATRWPDLIKSNGGGCNAILIRGDEIREHRTRRLCLVPERRWVHGVLAGDRWLANVHEAAHLSQAQLAAATVRRWAADKRLVIGGDFNLRSLVLDGLEWAGGDNVDHVFVRGLHAVAPARVLDRGRLSDHVPVLVDLA
jgi:endonuclease/exonuclease/phosphatase family metal-dependent hydrolase